MFLGAHMSISGGVYKSPLRGEKVGCEAMQIFTKSSNNWNAKPLLKDDITAFKSNCEKAGIKKVIAHDSYLINLASPKEDLYLKSKETFLIEMERAEILGIPILVFHPGNHMGEGVASGIERIASALTCLLKKTEGYNLNLALETTAGQGTSVGHEFSHIRQIIERTGNNDRLSVCVDTCHIFAAGYDLRSEKAYNKTFKEFDEEIGIEKICAFHLNDSKKDFKSKVDRHEHIGKGFLGTKPFSLLLNDLHFNRIPMVLETPKGEDGKEDRENLSILQGLIKKKN